MRILLAALAALLVSGCYGDYDGRYHRGHYARYHRDYDRGYAYHHRDRYYW